jgi:Ti-type conjugative transfer relaxase TraA
MAIYHLSVKPISRSGGKSSVASAAYRAGEKLHDERQERIFDYSRKEGVIHKEIILPEGASEWMSNREKLWNAVEAAEKRKDAQLAREVQFALPRELSEEQSIELAKEFVQNEFVDKGMIADLCVHVDKAKDGEDQPHVHVMLSLRRVTEKGFGLKERSWNSKENLLIWREAWAEYTNKYLALNDIEQRIDHRTLEEQGVALESQKKIGQEMPRIRDLRMEEHQRIARENGEKIFEDPAIALNAITYHQSTFTHQDLARFINRHTADTKQFQKAYEKVKGSEQIIALSDEFGSRRFTTKEMLGLEQRMLENAVELKNNAFIAPVSHDRGLGGVSLSPQQENALERIIGTGNLKCLVGYAGTGKSVLLSHAREIWEAKGYKVHGATLSGIAAENLEATSGIESRTLASRCYYWDKGEEKLTEKDILVVDEAGMLGSRQMARVLEEAKAAKAKVILIGDPQQLQAIEAGAAFRAIIEQVGYFELTEVRRQKELWQQEATKEFALQNTQQALSLYEQYGCIHVFETQATAKQALIEKWNDARMQPDKTQIMLAYTRRSAQELNEMARDYRKDGNELGEERQLQVASGDKQFATNDRIYFLKNDRFLGVKNGTLGTIEKIDGCQITVRLDGDRFNDTAAKTVTFDLKQYNHITHGYAATIHKAQGVTVDNSYILASKHLDSHAAYVGMSRHKERAELFWSKEEFTDKKELEQALSRDRSKDVALDYPSLTEQDTIHGNRKKSASELVAELVELSGRESEAQETETREQSYIREIRELNQKAERHPQTKQLYQEIKDLQQQQETQAQGEAIYLQREREQERERNGQRQRDLAARQLREQEKLREHRQAILQQQEKTAKIEKLVKDYHKFKDRYDTLLFAYDRGPYNIREVREQREKCANELCGNKDVLSYLQTHDKDLFKEMNKRIKEQEKAHATQEKQKGFELELTR